jgi:hypothetical protein
MNQIYDSIAVTKIVWMVMMHLLLCYYNYDSYENDSAVHDWWMIESLMVNCLLRIMLQSLSVRYYYYLSYSVVVVMMVLVVVVFGQHIHERRMYELLDDDHYLYCFYCYVSDWNVHHSYLVMIVMAGYLSYGDLSLVSHLFELHSNYDDDCHSYVISNNVELIETMTMTTTTTWMVVYVLLWKYHPFCWKLL